MLTLILSFSATFLDLHNYDNLDSNDYWSIISTIFILVIEACLHHFRFAVSQSVIFLLLGMKTPTPVKQQ